MQSAPPPQLRALLLFPPVFGGEGRLPGLEWALSQSRAPAADRLPTQPCRASPAAPPRAHGAWSADQQRRPRPRPAPWAAPEVCRGPQSAPPAPRLWFQLRREPEVKTGARLISIGTPEVCFHLVLPRAAAAADFGSAIVEVRKCGLGGGKLEAATARLGA